MPPPAPTVEVKQRGRGLALLALLAALGAMLAYGAGTGRRQVGAVGLFTTLPILWRESADLRGLLASDGADHWAKGAIAARGRIVPLDNLLRTGAVDVLLMAQPRSLSPQENVALDGWVRGGGRLLLFADPLLTGHSEFSLGDRRRPQDVVLLSPILSHWGLRLGFDDVQSAGERVGAAFDIALPVNLPGRIARQAGGAGADCVIGPGGLAAQCTIGKGRVLVIADAALFEAGDGAGDNARSRAQVLDRLLDRLLDGAAQRD